MIMINEIKDCVIAALPLVIIGGCLAVMFAGRGKADQDEEKNYMTEGMCIGMCMGVAFSTAMDLNLGLGISMGMLIGETVGMFMKK